MLHSIFYFLDEQKLTVQPLRYPGGTYLVTIKSLLNVIRAASEAPFIFVLNVPLDYLLF
jgi:hypothetical protein